MRRAMAAAHLWGIAVPGACEALAQRRSIGPKVEADIHLVNMFGNIERQSIWASIDASLADVATWAAWARAAPAEVLRHHRCP